MLLLVFCSILTFIYLSPLLLESPCICEEVSATRPPLIAHRLGSKYAPENTILALEKTVKNEYQSLKAVETDITIRYVFMRKSTK